MKIQQKYLITEITIIHKYLEVGHTHLEAHGVHAKIEQSKNKAKQICIPEDYQELISKARKKGYGCRVLSYDFFRNYSSAGVKTVKSIRPGSLNDTCCNY